MKIRRWIAWGGLTAGLAGALLSTSAAQAEQNVLPTPAPKVTVNYPNKGLRPGCLVVDGIFKCPPQAPSDLRVQGRTHNDVTLAWTDRSTGQHGLELQRKDGTGGPWSTVKAFASPGGAMGFTDAGRAPLTIYCYRIKTWNAHGTSHSKDPAEVCAQTLAPPPASPSGLAVTGTTFNSLTLRWMDNAANESSFSVERRQPPIIYWAGIESLPPLAGTGVVTWTDNGLSPGTYYCYRVKALNSSSSAYSNEACGTTSTPAAPANLQFDGAPQITPSRPGPFTPFTLSWKTCNRGGSVAGAFNTEVRLFFKEGTPPYDGKSLFESYPSYYVSSLPAGQCRSDEISYPIGLAAIDSNDLYIWEINLDSTLAVTETYELDNHASKTLNISSTP